MARKIQLPAIGGLRKTILLNQTSTGTAIDGLQGATITLAQLQAILNASSVNSGGGNIGGSGGAIQVGPGLQGGGPIVGTVISGLSAEVAFLVTMGCPATTDRRGRQVLQEHRVSRVHKAPQVVAAAAVRLSIFKMSRCRMMDWSPIFPRH